MYVTLLAEVMIDLAFSVQAAESWLQQYTLSVVFIYKLVRVRAVIRFNSHTIVTSEKLARFLVILAEMIIFVPLSDR